MWKIPAKSKITVLSADDGSEDEYSVFTPVKSDIASGIRFSVTEKIGMAVINPSVAKMMQRESMNVCATLGKSGWSLKANIHETGRSPAYASISLETGDFSTHVMNVTSSLNLPILNSLPILNLPILEKRVDSETSGMFQLVEASNVDSVKVFALLVMEKAENACSPACGNMLPSQRSKIKHLPPLEWEGWSLFLNDVSRAIEVFDVMIR